MNRLIIVLIRTKLGLKKNEHFRFTNQKSDATYYFTSHWVMKCERGHIRKSTVSLNWLIDSECKLEKVVK